MCVSFSSSSHLLPLLPPSSHFFLSPPTSSPQTAQLRGQATWSWEGGRGTFLGAPSPGYTPWDPRIHKSPSGRTGTALPTSCYRHSFLFQSSAGSCYFVLHSGEVGGWFGRCMWIFSAHCGQAMGLGFSTSKQASFCVDGERASFSSLLPS